MTNTPMRLLTRATCATLLLGTLPAYALEPVTSGDVVTYTAPARSPRMLPESIVPRRYYTNAPTIQTAATPAPAPAMAAVPLIMPAPAARQIPAEQPRTYTTLPTSLAPSAPGYVPAQQPVSYIPPPPMIYSVDPVVVQHTATQPPPSDAVIAPRAGSGVAMAYVPPQRIVAQTAPELTPTTHKTNRYTLGVEAFYDRYEEPDAFPDLGVDATYGSLTGSMTHYFNPVWFCQIEGRASYGRADYSSDDGKVNGISDYEFETRFMAGYDFAKGDTHWKPYAGLGTRLYLDYFKTPGVAGTYDRRIFQLYAPIGVTYEFPAYGLIFAPNLEVDTLLWGNVSSRLGAIPGYYNVENTQTSGIGLRGEFMVSQVHVNGSGWQFGPFFRYWDIDDSETETNPAGTWLEPRNTRLQAGAKLRYVF